jgi:hypothetical protein
MQGCQIHDLDCPNQQVGWIGTQELTGDAAKKNWSVNTTIDTHTTSMPRRITILAVTIIIVITTTLCTTTTLLSNSRSRSQS